VLGRKGQPLAQDARVEGAELCQGELAIVEAICKSGEAVQLTRLQERGRERERKDSSEEAARPSVRQRERERTARWRRREEAVRRSVRPRRCWAGHDLVRPAFGQGGYCISKY
jgi:hypothetical protein